LYTSGNVTAPYSLRSPVFYDTDNTAYFLDPIAGGNLYNSSLRLYGSHTFSNNYTEFKGVISTPDDWPTCTAPARIYTIGTINSVGGYDSTIIIEVIGSHRGYTTTSYAEYKKWVIYIGDKNFIKFNTISWF